MREAGSKSLRLGHSFGAHRTHALVYRGLGPRQIHGNPARPQLYLRRVGLRKVPGCRSRCRDIGSRGDGFGNAACLSPAGAPRHGIALGEMFDVQVLAADCAADGRYSFLLSAPPLEVTGGFGSPVNPHALK